MKARYQAFGVGISFFALAASSIGGAYQVSHASALRANGLTIKVGWAGPLSGDQAYFGQAYRDGAQMAAREFKFTGKLAGAKVKVVALDDGADPAQGVTVAHELIAAHAIGVVGHYNSGVTLATEPVYHAASIPQVTVSSNPSITRRGYKNVIQLGENDNVQGGDMARYAKKYLHVQSVAVFNDSEAFGQGVAQTFQAEAHRIGVKVFSNTPLNPSSQDYTSALSPVLQQHPQMIYFGGTVTPGGLLCRQARAQGFKGAFLGPDGIFDPAFIKGCGTSIGTAYVSTEGPPYNSSKSLRRFAARYMKLFGSAPGPYSVFGHDEMGYLLTAINAAQKNSGAAAVTKLHSITYHGVFGKEVVNARGEMRNPPSYIYRVIGTGFKLAWTNRK